MSSTTPRIRRQSTPIQLTPNKTPRRIIGNSAARIRGTPVEKVLASEGINLRSSPRRIRKIPFTQK